jgi:hypothetical protein
MPAEAGIQTSFNKTADVVGSVRTASAKALPFAWIPAFAGMTVVAAAEAGQGFALADQIQAGDALLAKRLVRPFDIVVS